MHKDCVMLQYAVGLAFDYRRTPILTMYSIHLKLCRVFPQELRISIETFLYMYILLLFSLHAIQHVWTYRKEVNIL